MKVSGPDDTVRGSRKNERPIDSGRSEDAFIATTGRHISSSVARDRIGRVAGAFFPARNATQRTRSPSGALSPPFGVVIPVSNSRPFALIVSFPLTSTKTEELFERSFTKDNGVRLK